MTGWKRGERGSSAQSSDFSDGTWSARNCGACSDRGRFGFGGGDEVSEDEADDGRAHAIVERGGDQAEEGAEFYAANPPFEGFGETAQQHRN